MWRSRVDLFRLVVFLRFLLCLFTVALACVAVPGALAGGPRFVTGQGLATLPGEPEGWATTQLNYFTDPGALSPYVSRSRADAMVAAAAAVWNVQTSSIALVAGGQLAEHVSGANSYFDYSNLDLVFPADVQAANESNVPVAIVYDTDGSVTDLLLGAGASDPEECAQNGVTQSVDDLGTDGHIHHAVVVLNGRCVGPEPEQLTQMQYQLMRAGGRVLGLAWSQLNDNVFTGASTITADQVSYWPVMHPLDVICTNYTYQCMLNPFTLRPDDLSALALLYPVLASNVPQGKQASDTDANFLRDTATFPTGQGMGWLNFTATRQRYGATDDYQIVSGMSGILFQQSLPSPVVASQATNQGAASAGAPVAAYEGLTLMRVVPVEGLSNVTLLSEGINPLYTGEYAIGPYAHVPAAPSGSQQGWVAYSLTPRPDTLIGVTTQANDAASTCNPGNDGTESSPAALDGTGWQNGQRCGGGHTSWLSATVRSGRSWTLEATATDESGAATTNKAEPVLGVWNAGDATGTFPSIADGAVPFNALALGVTQLQVSEAAVDTPVRFMVGDQYGAGRPDFTYTVRLLYADAVVPASVGAGGGLVTISGTGFRQGNAVLVNGVTAAVKSWTATQIVALVPSLAQVAVSAGTPVNVSVLDPSTGGSTTMDGALSYTNALDLLELVTAPSALETDVTASTPFAVRVLASDGTSPLSGVAVRLNVGTGSATFPVCGNAATCFMHSDENGLVSTTVTGAAPGPVSITATEIIGGAEVVVEMVDTAPERAVQFLSSAVYVAAGASDVWTLQLQTLQDGNPFAGAPTSWVAGNSLDFHSAMPVSAGMGIATAVVGGGAVGSGSVATVTGCAWSALCTTWTLHGVDASQLQAAVVDDGGQSVNQGALLQPVRLLVTDGAGHPVQDANLTIHQRVLSWEGNCVGSNRCAATAVLEAGDTVSTSGGDGSVVLQPMQVKGVPQTVEIAISYGTVGFLTLTLVKTPM